jgi:hypothetical protein
MTQRDAAVARAMRTLEAGAIGVATSFTNPADQTPPHASTAPFSPSTTRVPELCPVGLVAEIDRVCDQLRLL